MGYVGFLFNFWSCGSLVGVSFREFLRCCGGPCVLFFVLWLLLVRPGGLFVIAHEVDGRFVVREDVVFEFFDFVFIFVVGIVGWVVFGSFGFGFCMFGREGGRGVVFVVV